MRIVVALSLALFAAGCAVNPVSKRHEFVLMSEQQELQLGREMAAKFEQTLPLLPAEDPLVRYVDRVGQRVARSSDRPELIYRFHVIDDDTINAFALPGGYIYLHRGLLIHLNDESELAAVLGHEIGHVTARHAVARYTQIRSYQLGKAIASILLPVPQGVGQLTDMLALAVVQGYGREEELQADELSIRYLGAAGYDPRATVRLLETLKRIEQLRREERRDAGEKVEVYHGAFASHPETEKRIREAVARLRVPARIGEDRHASHLAMLQQLQGRPYSGSAREGAILGRRFIHPKLGLALAFPEGWVLHNGRDALTARVRRQPVYFRLTLRSLARRTTARGLLRKLVPERRIRGPIQSGVRGPWRWARVQADLSQPHVSKARVDLSVWLQRDRALLLALWAPRDQAARWQGQFDTIVASLHRYSRSRDGAVPVITLCHWRHGDSWRKLARRSGMVLGPFTARRLAVLNGMDPEERPDDGEVVKLVR
ncbi:MAG: hypothetical protein D6682_06580 [Zetaproteobacteria bacterium]|nr:MAG: hypothetical protein D6682_06580 [Zetaproteobacteria bacterium]